MKHISSKPVEMAAGIVRRTLTYGERTLMVEITFEKGSAIAKHSHPHEQIGCLVKGRLLFELGEEKADLGTGDSWVVPGDVEHAATALEDSLVVEVFSPVREEYK